jgi:hypothetical protein
MVVLTYVQEKISKSKLNSFKSLPWFRRLVASISQRRAVFAAGQYIFGVIIIIFHHKFRPGWPVSVSAVISSSSLLSGGTK